MNVYLKELSKELGYRGIAVDIFTRLQRKDLPQVVTFGPKARVIHLKAGASQPYDKNLVWYFLPEFIFRIKEFVHQEKIKYNVLHAHYWLSGWVAKELQKVWEVPVIQRFHTLGYLKEKAMGNGGNREHPLRLHFEQTLIRQADHLEAATQQGKRDMVEFYQALPEKVAVIPCGVNLSLFRPIPKDKARAYFGLPPEAKIILFVGRIDPVKGLDTLIKATSLLSKSLRLQLIIIGGGGNNQELGRIKALTQKLRIPHIVSFLPSQRQEYLSYYYSAADVFVLPSRYESFGMVALEAMACGTPVVASNVGGLPFTIPDGEAGFLFPVGNVEDLAEKLRLILANQELKNQFGQHAQGWAKNFHWANVADQEVLLYNKAITGFR
jgi:D-inositol-3-phosphate glycosyltransferase